MTPQRPNPLALSFVVALLVGVAGCVKSPDGEAPRPDAPDVANESPSSKAFQVDRVVATNVYPDEIPVGLLSDNCVFIRNGGGAWEISNATFALHWDASLPGAEDLQLVVRNAFAFVARSETGPSPRELHVEGPVEMLADWSLTIAVDAPEMRLPEPVDVQVTVAMDVNADAAPTVTTGYCASEL